MKKKSIFVTQPSLPKMKKLMPYLEKIWRNKIVSNNGPFHRQFEQELSEYLGVKYVSLVSNCTIGLIIALSVMKIKGEVITTPFSFIATASSLIWNNIKPVFVDIDSNSFNLDPKKIESSITKHTSAIMPVHTYGYPCDVEKIQKIANKNNLKVIYDAAHAFGVECHCGSILKHGDISVLSFHATKVFNTFEGGAIICKDKKIKDLIDQFKNFGFNSQTEAKQIGLNGKMSEFNAALGLLQLKEIDKNINKRKKIFDYYTKFLKKVAGIRVHFPSQIQKSNYSYYPIIIEKNYPLSRDQLYKKLLKNGIYARKYWYPLITNFSVYRKLFKTKYQDFKNAKIVTNRVICLPIYPELSLKKIKFIINLIK